MGDSQQVFGKQLFRQIDLPRISQFDVQAQLLGVRRDTTTAEMEIDHPLLTDQARGYPAREITA